MAKETRRRPRHRSEDVAALRQRGRSGIRQNFGLFPERINFDATDKSRSPYIAIPPVVVFDLASVPYVVG